MTSEDTAARRTADAPGEARFGSGPAFTVGAEEELFVVDPVTGAARDTALETVEAVAEPARGGLTGELHTCQIELISDICRTAGDAAGVLEELRGAVRATGTGLLGAGMHPTMLEGEAQVTPKSRYREIHRMLGDAIASPVSGLHVHVGMPDRETAVRAFNTLRRHVPLLQALAANSPFRHGRDTGLASARSVTIAEWPRSGVPAPLRDFDDFCSRAALLCRAAEVPDYTHFWWKLRPHPRLGTVEVRAMDTQTDPDDTAALVALVHVLAREAADATPRRLDREPLGEIIDEGIFRAARFGVEATLPDADGRLHPVADVLEETLRRTAPVARELGCEEELARLPHLVREGGGAGRQRALAATLSLDALAAALTRDRPTAPSGR